MYAVFQSDKREYKMKTTEPIMLAPPLEMENDGYDEHEAEQFQGRNGVLQDHSHNRETRAWVDHKKKANKKKSAKKSKKKNRKKKK